MFILGGARVGSIWFWSDWSNKYMHSSQWRVGACRGTTEDERMEDTTEDGAYIYTLQCFLIFPYTIYAKIWFYMWKAITCILKSIVAGGPLFNLISWLRNSQSNEETNCLCGDSTQFSALLGDWDKDFLFLFCVFAINHLGSFVYHAYSLCKSPVFQTFNKKKLKEGITTSLMCLLN